MITARRHHDISCGHRVVGHESKCRFLHGHNYRFHFHLTGVLDSVGRVIDFGVIKTILCQWLEDNYDHKFLIWDQDPLLEKLMEISPESVRMVSYNPTAENIAKHMVLIVAPKLLHHLHCKLSKCIIEETRKCHASYEIPQP
jgi:6-pyruvoyltetrahydropterin/6-carboxytetrahydropterin synthase